MAGFGMSEKGGILVRPIYKISKMSSLNEKEIKLRRPLLTWDQFKKYMKLTRL